MLHPGTYVNVFINILHFLLYTLVVVTCSVEDVFLFFIFVALLGRQHLLCPSTNQAFYVGK